MSIDRYIGEIQVWPMASIPPGWALCDGRWMDRQSNQALFSLIGFQFGGDGQNQFALPDLRGRTPVGASYNSNDEPMAVGTVGGTAAACLDDTNLPDHGHDLMASTEQATAATILNALPAATAAGDPPIYASRAPDVQLDPTSIQPTGTIQPSGASQPHDNMQPSLGLNFIIAIAGLLPNHQ
jgi:microcystin-dependent protein